MLKHLARVLILLGLGAGAIISFCRGDSGIGMMMAALGLIYLEGRL